MIIKLDSLAVPAKHAMSAKTRVELKFPSPSLEKRKQNQLHFLLMGKWQVLPSGQGGVPLYYHSDRQTTGNVLDYHHLSVLCLHFRVKILYFFPHSTSTMHAISRCQHHACKFCFLKSHSLRSSNTMVYPNIFLNIWQDMFRLKNQIRFPTLLMSGPQNPTFCFQYIFTCKMAWLEYQVNISKKRWNNHMHNARTDIFEILRITCII